MHAGSSGAADDDEDECMIVEAHPPKKVASVASAGVLGDSDVKGKRKRTQEGMVDPDGDKRRKVSQTDVNADDVILLD